MGHETDSHGQKHHLLSVAVDDGLKLVPSPDDLRLSDLFERLLQAGLLAD